MRIINALNKKFRAIGLVLLLNSSIIAFSSCESNDDNSYNVDRFAATQGVDLLTMDADAERSFIALAPDGWIPIEMLLESATYGERFLLPHPNSSNFFIFLTDGRGYVLRCPCGYIWDAELQTCYLPRNWRQRWGIVMVAIIGVIGGAVGGGLMFAKVYNKHFDNYEKKA
jgi:hypothetical protein